MEQVAGKYCLGLRPEELRPGRAGPPRRGVDPGGVQDFPDGRGADLVAESGEFAVDAAVAPAGVLGGQAHDQGAEPAGMAVGRAGCAGWPSGGRPRVTLAKIGLIIHDERNDPPRRSEAEPL